MINAGKCGVLQKCVCLTTVENMLGHSNGWSSLVLGNKENCGVTV